MANLQHILKQEVTRKEFMQYVGTILLGMIGVTALLQNLAKPFAQQASKTQGAPTRTSGYGMSPYGG